MAETRLIGSDDLLRTASSAARGRLNQQGKAIKKAYDIVSLAGVELYGDEEDRISNTSI